jgi:hypothetical protein
MTPDQVWMRGWLDGIAIALLELLAPVVACYLALTIVFFRKGETAVGILCTICIVIFGLIPFGIILALIFGWRNATRWQIKAFMTVWTGLVILVTLHLAAMVVLREVDSTAVRAFFRPSF